MVGKEGVIGFLSTIYNSVNSYVPEQYRVFLIITFYTLLIAIYSIFIWKFYMFLAKRDILKLNLKKYNKTLHPFLNKLMAIFLFFVEYIVILPIFVIFWYSIFSIFLLLLSSQSQPVRTILLISASVVAAIRLTAYFSNDLSKDLAKIFPFTVLAIFLLNPDFFIIGTFIERVSEIPLLFSQILKYLVFIVVIEVFMRVVFVIVDLIYSGGGGGGGGGEGMVVPVVKA